MTWCSTVVAGGVVGATNVDGVCRSYGYGLTVMGHGVCQFVLEIVLVVEAAAAAAAVDGVKVEKEKNGGE